MTQSIFSKQPQMLATVVVLLVDDPESILWEELELELQLVGSATSTSSETTLNFNNFDKSFNSNLRCSSQSSSKLGLVTHNWPL